MNIQTPPPASGPQPAPSLDEFRQAADRHEAVFLSLEGENWQVNGVGVMPGSGRAVAWVRPINEEADTASAFVQALGQSFTAGISRAVARELGLGPNPGQPLSSRAVKLGIDMAATSQQALGGVDFFTRMQFSATKGGSEFKRICTQEGPLPSTLSQADKERIDHFLDEQFNLALSRGEVPVTNADAAKWLKEALHSLK